MHNCGVLSVLELRIELSPRVWRAFSHAERKLKGQLVGSVVGLSSAFYFFKLQIVFLQDSLVLTGRTNHSRTTRQWNHEVPLSQR